MSRLTINQEKVPTFKKDDRALTLWEFLLFGLKLQSTVDVKVMA